MGLLFRALNELSKHILKSSIIIFVLIDIFYNVIAHTLYHSLVPTI